MAEPPPAPPAAASPGPADLEAVLQASRGKVPLSHSELAASSEATLLDGNAGVSTESFQCRQLPEK